MCLDTSRNSKSKIFLVITDWIKIDNFLSEFDKKWNMFFFVLISVHSVLCWWMCINNFHFPENTNLPYGCEKYAVINQERKKIHICVYIQYFWVRNQTAYSFQSSAGQFLKPSVITVMNEPQSELMLQPIAVIYKSMYLSGLRGDLTQSFSYVTFLPEVLGVQSSCDNMA